MSFYRFLRTPNLEYLRGIKSVSLSYYHADLTFSYYSVTEAAIERNSLKSIFLLYKNIKIGRAAYHFSQILKKYLRKNSVLVKLRT